MRATLVSRSLVSRPAEGSAIAMLRAPCTTSWATFLQGPVAGDSADLAYRMRRPPQGHETRCLPTTPLAGPSSRPASPTPRPSWNREQGDGARVGDRIRLGVGGHRGPPLVGPRPLPARPGIDEAVLILARDTLTGPPHRGTLTWANNLAVTLWAVGDPARARALLEEVLHARRRVLGAEHPDILAVWAGDLAVVLWAVGDTAGARALNEEVLEARLRVLGAEHPDILMSASNLAKVLAGCGP